MIERFRVFRDGEKQEVVDSLVRLHFIDYKKSFNKIYTNNRGGFISIDIQNDFLKYNKNVSDKKIIDFKLDYEINIAKELKTRKINDLENLLNPSKI